MVICQATERSVRQSARNSAAFSTDLFDNSALLRWTRCDPLMEGRRGSALGLWSARGLIGRERSSRFSAGSHRAFEDDLLAQWIEECCEPTGEDGVPARNTFGSLLQLARLRQVVAQKHPNRYKLRRSAHSTNPSATDWHFMTIALEAE